MVRVASTKPRVTTTTRRISRRVLARATSVRWTRASFSRGLAAAVPSRLWRSAPPKRAARMSGAIASSADASDNSDARAANARSGGVPDLIRMTKASMLARRLAGADGTVDSIAATNPRWAATLSRRVSIQVANASRRLVTRLGDDEDNADRSVHPTAAPMRAPTGQRVMSPTTAAPIRAAAADWRVAASIPLANDIFFATGVVANRPATTRAIPTPMPVSYTHLTTVIGRRSQSALRNQSRPGGP